MVKCTKKQKASISKRLKTMVWNYRIGSYIGLTLCPCCNDNHISQSEFDCGHIKAESKNGSLKLNNLLPICRQCNLSMGNINMRRFMQTQFKRNLDKVLLRYESNKITIFKIFKILMSKKCKKKKREGVFRVLKNHIIIL